MSEETIGERLRRLRLAAGLSQRELESEGVSYAYISRIEGGQRVPSVKAMRRLAPKLGVSAHELEFGEPDGVYLLRREDGEVVAAFRDEGVAEEWAELASAADEEWTYYAAFVLVDDGDSASRFAEERLAAPLAWTASRAVTEEGLG